MAETRWETVPKGTPPSRCKSKECRATIYFVERPRANGKGVARVPVDCDVAGGAEPDSLTPGKGVNHYTTCSAPEEF